jgi:hypothetical protein
MILRPYHSLLKIGRLDRLCQWPLLLEVATSSYNSLTRGCLSRPPSSPCVSYIYLC